MVLSGNPVAWNVGCVLYIFWVGGQCLIQFVDLIVWRDNAINVAPVWCDITIRFYIAASLGVVCSSLVINRRLYYIMSILTDLAIGLGIPIVGVALFWFYQGHRFDIYEGVGCIEEYPNTFLAYLLYIVWPIPIGLASATYCVLTLRTFLRQRREFHALTDANPHLTFGRYLRLMGLAALNALVIVPLAAYVVVANLRSKPMYEWRGLADLHWGFSRVDSIGAVMWRSHPAWVSTLNFRQWEPIACALVFFAFFGLAEEARRHYRRAFFRVAKRLGIKMSARTCSSNVD
ncbi:GPCR fungal pheromone mating factor [Earliella scabrosa]|nr:GPCR fungal pheromone mating factor [Earliella scabrosa]